MELEITVYNNFLSLKGPLNKSNIAFFEERVSEAFKQFDKLTINIDSVTSIDADAVSALRGLHYDALDDNKEFIIVGLGCKEIYDHFNSIEAA